LKKSAGQVIYRDIQDIKSKMRALNLGESLAEIMQDKNIDSKSLASILGVAHETVNSWKANRGGIGLSYLVRLCQHFECSLEYLTGGTEINTKPKKFVLENFGKQVRKVMKARDISTYKLEQETKFNGKYFNVWDRGSDPKLSTLIELANYFKCSLDELVGLE